MLYCTFIALPLILLAGMIMWKKAKRAVNAETAAAIAAVARDGGAVPVAVFVDEDCDEIVGRCALAGISTAQLHGDGARATLQLLPSALEVWGGVATHPPTASAHSRV